MADLGIDLSGLSDLDATGAMASGRVCLAQAVARRLMTPRGRLIDDANYGFDLTGLLNDDLGTGDLARIRSGVEAEALKDERVASAVANVQLISGVMIVSLTIQDGNGPFTLVLSVTDVTVTILSVN